MQFATIFTEYIVSGFCALFWALPLIKDQHLAFDSFNIVTTPAYLPLIIALGISIDLLAAIPLRPFKIWMTKRATKSFESRMAAASRSLQSDDRMLLKECQSEFLAWHSPELYRQYQLRSSRDRIARGAVLNAVIVTLIGFLRPDLLGLEVGSGALTNFLWIAPSVTFFFLLVWMWFQTLSIKWRLAAVRVILTYPKEKVGGQQLPNRGRTKRWTRR